MEIDVPEQFEVACAGVPVKKDGIVSADLENIRDFAVVVSDFMDVDTFETQGVAIRNYYLRTGDTEAYREISKQTIIDSFEFYTELPGDYQRREYFMAQYIDGMEYSGFTMPSETMSTTKAGSMKASSPIWQVKNWYSKISGPVKLKRNMDRTGLLKIRSRLLNSQMI